MKQAVPFPWDKAMHRATFTVVAVQWRNIYLDNVQQATMILCAAVYITSHTGIQLTFLILRGMWAFFTLARWLGDTDCVRSFVLGGFSFRPHLCEVGSSMRQCGADMRLSHR